jgi:hypothetical protein
MRAFLRILLVSLALAPLSCVENTKSDDPIVVIPSNNSQAQPNATNPNATNPNATNPNATNPNATNPNASNNTDINSNCPEEARLVYLVEVDQTGTSQGKLVQFNPSTLSFREIGALQCPTGAGNTPFSMSVDRQANAWVLYASGDIFRVNTKTAACEATDFIPNQSGYQVFGMGFALNRPETADETLYVAGGDPALIGTGGSGKIGYVTFPDLTLYDVTTINGWPEMSGTAAAELWAFFPTGTSPRVARISPATGQESDVIPVTGIDGQANAWAFAHWGGDFWLFYKSQTDPSSRVFQVKKSGSVEEVLTDTGRYIVGAGVSTCAPLYIL